MPEIFNALPGLEVTVGSISRGLAQMWEQTAASGRAAPSSDDVKATQVNVVLHLGFQTTVDDARAQFQTMLRFAQRYPSRVVVLCPLREDAGATEMRAKIYGECFLGKSKGDTRCVEFVTLSYPLAARARLEDQVSICLSTDLPLYYWAHRFSTSSRLADYTYLLTRAKRVLLDSSIAPADALTYPWPNPASLRDLVYSRLLPARQTVGQFLARYEPAVLAEGLRSVTVLHGPDLAAEASVSTGWLRRRLAACGAQVDQIRFERQPAGAGVLGIQFGYADSGKFFRWQGDLQARHALFEADFGAGPAKLPAPVSLLSPEMALSEAMFF
ncbi:MAG TPA: glucose-6-phosphate dehydrogenase assembly protein OpcA [Opitutus sp.]|nr:glucose-6-phosphate dehydrogenase assembly protein OpcA [Opitutus sp.]